jgi:hypothetical protein
MFLQRLSSWSSDNKYYKEGGRTEEYYADVIAKRKEARKRIQELEEA